ncbi:MAG: alpha/beta fold hydrolase [Deltaproteobacteria bacterium]|nr:alpha/beta fold hydrolase [Deltaproteobacteria bacterium]
MLTPTSPTLSQPLTPHAALARLAGLTRWVDRAAFPWEPRFVDTGDGRQHLVDVGRGEPVVLVHGTPTWSFEWRHVIAALAPTHRVIAVDHLGFGLSDRPTGADYRPEAHARRFARLMDELALDRVTLVVHDFGGPIALPFALARPERVARLAVTNTWMWSFEDDPLMARRARAAGGRLGRFLYRWLNASLRMLLPYAYGDRKKLTRAIHRQYLAPFADRRARVDVLFALARALLGSSEHYRALWARREALGRFPVAILWGLADRAFRPSLLERWREAAPHAEVTTFEGAGHWPHEEAPAPYVAALSRFIAGTPSPAISP